MLSSSHFWLMGRGIQKNMCQLPGASRVWQNQKKNISGDEGANNGCYSGCYHILTCAVQQRSRPNRKQWLLAAKSQTNQQIERLRTHLKYSSPGCWLSQQSSVSRGLAASVRPSSSNSRLFVHLCVTMLRSAIVRCRVKRKHSAPRF